jgi:hypothetical protein
LILWPRVPKKPVVIRFDLLSYVAATCTAFFFFVINRHLWTYPAPVQAVGILIFIFCWYLITMGGIAASRVRITRKLQVTKVAETP